MGSALLNREHVVAPPQVVRWGRVPYRDAWSRQQDWWARRQAGELPDTLALVEHPPVYTLGVRAEAAHVLWGPAERAARGIELLAVDRGGDVTYHGPGQVVGYAFVDLAARNWGLDRYLRTLEEVMIQALAEFGMEAGRKAGCTGVWVSGQKIGAIGIKVSRWVTRHGFALNVDPDLDHFRGIVPCGLTHGVTSLKALGTRVSWDEAAAALERAWKREVA